MTDLHDRFRSLDRLSPPDLWSEAVQRAAADQRRRVLGPWGMNRSVVIALVLLSLLITSIAIAVAAGLLREDSAEPNPFSLAGPVAHCDQTLPEGVLVRVIDSTDQIQLTAYEDGLVITGYPNDWGGAPPEVGLDGSWSERHLTAEGSDLLIDALTSSLPNCQSFEHSGFLDIRARVGADVHAIRLGSDVLETRVTTPDQAAAVSDLAGRLDDPDLGLNAGGWVESEWQAYVPERWRFSLQFFGPSDRDFPPSDGIVLPDGSTLRTFGSELPLDSVDPSAAPQGLSMLRCGVTDAEEARAIEAILTEAGATPEPYSGWQFTDGEQVGELGGFPLYNLVSITVAGLLPHEPDCMSEALPAATPTPAPAPSIEADEPAPYADACDYVPPAIVAEVIGPINGETEHYPGWSTDWAFCWHPVEPGGMAIGTSRRPLPAARAAEQARALFGDVGFSAEHIAGHDVYFNGCISTDGQCRSAIAIAVEPHFVVITWEPGSQATLRELAERLIAQLDMPQT
jgi:hypothetical protein